MVNLLNLVHKFIQYFIDASHMNMYNVSWCWVAGVCIVVILRCGWLVLVVPYCNNYNHPSLYVWCTDVTMFGILVVYVV